MIPDLANLHFLRPSWLWALLALPLLAAWWWRRRHRASVWREAVDPHLLPRLLDHRGERRGHAALALGALGYLLAVLALAGPSWRQTEQPLWQSRTPLVVALDLSSSSLADDLPPSRLAQARAKLGDLLAQRQGGQVGLVAYAGDAFTVAPLTDDVANVALFLDALHPQVMPVDGQRGDRAIEWSVKLLQQAGFDRGHILLLTDHADDKAREAATAAHMQGYRVSALGLGTAAGALYKRPDGSIANTRLGADSLRQLARAGGGGFAALTRDDDDLQSLGVLDPAAAEGATRGESGRSWHDDGYWLLIPLMLLALLAFRRGAPIAVVLLVLWLPGQGAHAAELWQRPDQLAHEQMQQAAQAYREGDFARAAQLYGALESADSLYNRGNALAKAGRYAEAIDAYEQALDQRPGMQDAIANKQAVEAAMKRKPPPGKQQGQQQPQDGKQEGSQQPQDSQQGEGQGQSPSQQPGKSEPPSEPNESDPADSGDNAAPREPQSPKPTDAEAQQSANQAQRQRMQQALQDAQEDGQADDPAEAAPVETAEQRERRLANEVWLRRIPDDPGGLLREKFRLEHQRRRMQGGWEE
ncbi:VWA domain-containing protein [Novilysobacter erysipheiresistens]|uniref:VWA domain-containing protein n=1 Tax=Novilysobacter erysipheiresistens TaxID=1749332 RepID=A0ABU7Z167_9GAMM